MEDAVAQVAQVVTTGDAALTIDDSVMAALQFELRYETPQVRHIERRFAPQVNMWRDVFPRGLEAALMRKQVGDRVSIGLDARDLAGDKQASSVQRIALRDFDDAWNPALPCYPDKGRFLPQGVLHRAVLGGVYRQSLRPFRVLDVDASGVTVDLGAPFSGRGATLDARVEKVMAKRSDGGGRCQDWVLALLDGAGMQLRRAPDLPTEFFVRDWAARMAEGGDDEFYATPRQIAHIDSQAAAVVRDHYAHLLPRGAAVLDLMSSTFSHLPLEHGFAKVTGLGMNAQELAANDVLNERVVHDLNAVPSLPFADSAFDAVVCTSSVEYLTQPFEVFREVARVLRPGGVFAVVWSMRWFPPKVIKLWRDAHPYERLGIVIEYFLQSGVFTGLESLAVSGYARPEDDPHAHETDLSDPVFAVWGRCEV